MGRVAALATFFVLAAVAPHPTVRVAAPEVVAPLADPALVPGVGRCTSDEVCTVTDEEGTRPARRLALSP